MISVKKSMYVFFFPILEGLNLPNLPSTPVGGRSDTHVVRASLSLRSPLNTAKLGGRGRGKIDF